MLDAGQLLRALIARHTEGRGGGKEGPCAGRRDWTRRQTTILASVRTVDRTVKPIPEASAARVNSAELDDDRVRRPSTVAGVVPKLLARIENTSGSPSAVRT